MTSTKWIYQKAEKDDVEIDEPEMFKKPGFLKKAFLNIVTILGPARGGKSTLMNNIIGKDVFDTSHSMHGCTEGVWISENVEEIGDGAVMYVDTEGQGNDTVKNSSKLLTPVVFLSKVFILNIMGAILKDELLDKLKIFVHVCERIKHEKTPRENPLKLGHLIITARDFNFEETEEEVYTCLFEKETGSKKGVKERNNTREKIHAVFGEPTVFLFRESLAEIETNGDLKKRVDDLKKIIQEKVSEPREFYSNTCLKPDNVNEITKKIVDQLNTPNEAFELQSIVDLVQQREVDAVKNRLISLWLETIESKILPKSDLKPILEGEMENLIRQFDEETSRMDCASNHQVKVKKELEQVFRRQLDDTTKRNGILLKRISTAESHFQNNLKQVFHRISLDPDKRDEIEVELCQEIDAALEGFDQDLEDIDERSKYKEKVRSKLSVFSYNEKENTISENKKKRRDEREIIEKEKMAFIESLKESNLNIDLPRNDIENCLQQKKTELFSTFDKNTEVIKLELGHRKEARNELENHCTNEVNEMIKKNKKAEDDKKALILGARIGGALFGGGIAGGVGTAAAGALVAAELTVGVVVGVTFIAATAGIGIGVVAGFGIYFASKYVLKNKNKIVTKLKQLKLK